MVWLFFIHIWGGVRLRSTLRYEVDQLPGHLVLLLLQVFYLEVKLRKFLVNPIQSRPYHSGENSINIIPHYCCKLETHLHNAVSLSLRSEPLTPVGNKHSVGKERRVCLKEWWHCSTCLGDNHLSSPLTRFSVWSISLSSITLRNTPNVRNISIMRACKYSRCGRPKFLETHSICRHWRSLKWIGKFREKFPNPW